MGDSEKEVGKLHLSMNGQKDWSNEIPFCMMERKIKLKPPTEMGTQCTQQDDTLTFYVRCGEEVPAMHIVVMTLQDKIDKEFSGHPCLLCVCLSLKLQNWLGDKSNICVSFCYSMSLAPHLTVTGSTSHCLHSGCCYLVGWLWSIHSNGERPSSASPCQSAGHHQWAPASQGISYQ